MFVQLMFELWDDMHSGSFDCFQFDRAAHQHPLLVQGFQLEQVKPPHRRMPY